MRERDGSRVWTATTVAVVVVMSAALGWLYLRANTGPNAGGVAPTPAMFEGAPSTLDAALAAAGKDGLVFAYATADWCPPCQVYKRTTLVDPAVEAWVRKHAIPVYVDTDHNAKDAATLGVRSIPQTTLLRGDGTVLVREVGALRADELLAALRGAVGK